MTAANQGTPSGRAERHPARLKLLVAALAMASAGAQADTAYHALAGGTFSQDWSNAALITASDVWSGVPSIMGCRGDGLVAGATGADPQTELGGENCAVVDVNANQGSPSTNSSGGVTEFDGIADPVVALQGSGTADAPYLLLHLDTTGVSNVTLSFNARDIDGSADNAVQPIAVHYRIGDSGAFTNLAAGYVADASSGPSLATLVTPVSVTLPVAADNQARVQVRIMTANAGGSDEWIGIDDIQVGTGVAVDHPPAVSASTPADGAVEVAQMATVTVDFSESVAVDAAAFGLQCPSGSAVGFTADPALPAAGTARVVLTPDAPLPAGTPCQVTVTASKVRDQDGTADTMAADHVFTFTVESGVATPISAVQGSGTASPLAGQVVTVEGIVVGAFPDASVGGFFVQEEDADADADPATSEGIFVYSDAVVALGDKVRVRASATEYYGETELNSVQSVQKLSSGNPLPAAAAITLPIADLADWERYEGMRVAFPQALVVNETYQLGRGGQVLLGSERRVTGTEVAAPGAAALAVAADNARKVILLDDGSEGQNPDPIVHPAPTGLTAQTTLRGGDSVSGVEGVLTYRWAGWSGTDAWRVYPTATPAFVASNPRPAAPPAVDGNIRVVGMNVLNYFTTLGGAAQCGPSASLDCRGASDAEEFTRQRDKLFAEAAALDADVIGMMEMENTDGSTAIGNFVDGLNAVVGAGTYAYVATGTLGTDAIRVALVYKPSRLAPVGSPAILTSAVDPDFLDSKNRPSLAQTFQNVGNGRRFTVVVNHLKSKGSACDDVGDPDLGDGQGNCSQTRRKAAQALADWLAGDPTGSGVADYLLIGDFNAYSKEEAVTMLESAGYAKLTHDYSYVFDGAAGALDHAFASAGLAAKVAGAAKWHINADEPSVLDYNKEYKSAGQVASLYDSGPYRASDHDPVIVGLALVEAQAIAFDALANRTLGDPPFTVSANGGGSGNPVSFASQTPSICATGGGNGASVSLLAAGTCTLRTSQVGNQDYTAAVDVERSFTVLPAGSGTSISGTTSGGPATAEPSAGWVFAPAGNGTGESAGFIALQGDAKSPPSTPPGNYNFPYGLFDFVLLGGAPGATATVTITYPQVLPPGTVYMKYGPTSDSATPHWYVFPALISGNTVTLAIADGGLGDDDLDDSNGIIYDQGGPAVPAALDVAAIPALSGWGVLVASGLTALAGLFTLFGRGRRGRVAG